MRGLSEAAVAAEATSAESSPTNAGVPAPLLPQAALPTQLAFAPAPRCQLPLPSPALTVSGSGLGDPKWPPASTLPPAYAAQWQFYSQHPSLASTLCLNPCAPSLICGSASNTVPVPLAADCNRNHQHELLLPNHSQDKYAQALTSYALVNYYGTSGFQSQSQPQKLPAAQLAMANSIAVPSSISSAAVQPSLECSYPTMPSWWPSHAHVYAQHFGTSSGSQRAEQHALSRLSAAGDPSCV